MACDFRHRHVALYSSVKDTRAIQMCLDLMIVGESRSLSQVLQRQCFARLCVFKA